MRRLLLLTFLAVYSISTMAQNGVGPVPFVAYWSIGDSYTYDVTKTNREWKNGELTKDEVQNYEGTFTVIDSTATSYTCRWNYKSDIKNTYDIPDNLMDKFKKYELMTIEYTTDELGTFQGLLNWEEIGEIMVSMLDDIIDFYGDSNQEVKKQVEKSMLPVKEIYSSKEGIELLVLKELQYFHFPMGLEFNAEEVFEFEAELPNFLGGKPLRADAKIYFDYVDRDQGFCIFMHEMKINDDDAKAMVNQLMKSMNLNDKEVKQMMNEAVFNIIDYNEFEYFYDPGIPQTVSTIREVDFVLANEKTKKIEELKMSIIL